MATNRKLKRVALTSERRVLPDVFLAAERNDVKALEIALQRYSVNERDDSGMTPLHYAASTHAVAAVEFLLKQPGIDPTLADKFGRSAATVAYECFGTEFPEFHERLNRVCYPWLYTAEDSAPDSGSP